VKWLRLLSFSLTILTTTLLIYATAVPEEKSETSVAIPAAEGASNHGTTLLSAPSAFRDLVLRESGIFQVDPELISALIYCESGWDPNCVNINSGSIDMGLCQFNSRYLSDHGVKDPFDSAESIRACCRLIAGLQVLYESRLAVSIRETDTATSFALRAYNAGVDGALRGKGAPYARRVMQRWLNQKRNAAYVDARLLESAGSKS